MVADGWNKDYKGIRVMETKKIVYIAGKITGDPNYKEKFDRAEKYLLDLGYVVLNPTILPVGLNHNSYLQIGLTMIDAADAIYMLKSYMDSLGATLELNYAMYQNKIILFEGLSL